MENIRRIYQKAVVNPILQVEDLWKGYDAYENGLNRVTAKKILGERSAAYMSARTVCKERKNLLDSTPKFWLAVPPTGTPKEVFILVVFFFFFYFFFFFFIFLFSLLIFFFFF